MFVEVIPAYGRDYSNQRSIQQDWDAGKDFQIPWGPYLNKQDATQQGLEVLVRYAKQTKVYAVK